nr:low-density lipoprotein receptor-related protein 1-like [Lytechinus pictus]
MCIPLHNLCDGAQHCIGGTDELDCDFTICEKAACKEECQVTPDKGVMCYCGEGKVIDPEEPTRCIPDTKMCNKVGRCSQQCVNGKGTYVCKCYPGYQMSSDGWTCKSNATANPYLIFSNRNQLRRVNLATSEYNVLVFNLHNSIAVDFHYSNSSIYWTDVVDDKIYRGWLDENSPNAGLRNIEPVIEAGLATCEGLAVDWIGGNLYWVESHLDQIEVARLDGAMRTTVVASNMESPGLLWIH